MDLKLSCTSGTLVVRAHPRFIHHFRMGQERFRSMSSPHYRDAAGAILVYDCTDAASFESVKFWA